MKDSLEFKQYWMLSDSLIGHYYATRIYSYTIMVYELVNISVLFNVNSMFSSFSQCKSELNGGFIEFSGEDWWQCYLVDPYLCYLVIRVRMNLLLKSFLLTVSCGLFSHLCRLCRQYMYFKRSGRHFRVFPSAVALHKPSNFYRLEYENYDRTHTSRLVFLYIISSDFL